jgi:hypothetical protein
VNFPKSLDREIAELERDLSRGMVDSNSEEYSDRTSGILQDFQRIFVDEQEEKEILRQYLGEEEFGKAVNDLKHYEAARRGGFDYEEKKSRVNYDKWGAAIHRYDQIRREIEDLPVSLRGVN